MGVVEGDDRRVGDRRTMALRAPGAGGFTPAHSVAASNPCLNCGTNMQLAFCPECGQPQVDSDPTFREFLHEVAEEFLHWDGKLGRTFRMLVTKPGALTNEYLAGRRVRYISPLRVYLTCSLLFFFVSAVVPQRASVSVREGALVRTQIGFITVTEPDSVAAIAALDSMAHHKKWISRTWGKHFGAAMRQRGSVIAKMAAAVPNTMFVLVPLFAALVMLAFRRSRRRFPQHLAFALHVHAFLFLALTIMLARRLTTALPVSLALVLICMGAVVVYLVRAMRNVYEVSTGGALARTGMVGSIYSVLFGVAMVATFVLIVLLEF
ncbi:MAG: DUF3667 domain-containing protein [Gemmatimonadota bacterium]|nr:DUF3667 domain-containing protein [Gemmatimonadota bacterium]